MTDIIGKIRNFRTPYFYPWAWAALLLSTLVVGLIIGIGLHIWCMVSLGFM